MKKIEKNANKGISMGMCLGVAIGTSLGVAFDNISMILRRINSLMTRGVQNKQTPLISGREIIITE